MAVKKLAHTHPFSLHLRHFQKAKSSFVALSGRCRNESEIHGGSLTVYGGEVFADGTDWGAGIGGGEDADGAKVAIIESTSKCNLGAKLLIMFEKHLIRG